MNPTTPETLQARRRQAQAEWAARRAGPHPQIIIGQGSCGIAAGAPKVWEAFADELKKSGLTDVRISQTGCMGLCYSEPTVEVRVPGMPPILYGKVNADVARRIVRKHIVGKMLINDHIYDWPATEACARPKAD